MRTFVFHLLTLGSFQCFIVLDKNALQIHNHWNILKIYSQFQKVHFWMKFDSHILLIQTHDNFSRKWRVNLKKTCHFVIYFASSLFLLEIHIVILVSIVRSTNSLVKFTANLFLTIKNEWQKNLNGSLQKKQNLSSEIFFFQTEIKVETWNRFEIVSSDFMSDLRRVFGERLIPCTMVSWTKCHFKTIHLYMPVRFCIFKLNKCQKTDRFYVAYHLNFFLFFLQPEKYLTLVFREKVFKFILFL